MGGAAVLECRVERRLNVKCFLGRDVSSECRREPFSRVNCYFSFHLK